MVDFKIFLFLNLFFNGILKSHVLDNRQIINFLQLIKTNHFKFIIISQLFLEYLTIKHGRILNLAVGFSRLLIQFQSFPGALFTVCIALSDNVWYLLNLIVQSLGNYVQYIIGTATFTGAFVQEGNYPGAQDHEIEWINENTVFYCEYSLFLKNLFFKGVIKKHALIQWI